MGSQASLQFGVEIELLLGSRKKTYSSWAALAKDVHKRLTKAGINNHINESGSKSPENYREWSIVQEVTIPGQPNKNLWGIELVSPVYPAGWYWAADIEAIFAAVQGDFTIHASPHCSTHVHVSETPSPLSGAELAALAKAALYFEPALDSLVPAGRRSSAAYWCQSNRANPALAQHGLAHCLALLDRASGEQTCQPVVEAMNLFPAGSAYGRAHGKKHDFVRGKVYKWDFSGMLARGAGGTGMGTVEFRQPPGSRDAAQACGWVVLALAFVAGATAGGFDVVDADNGATAEELWALLMAGAAVLGWDDVGPLEAIFAARE